MRGRDRPGLVRPAAEVEARMRPLEGWRDDAGAAQRVEGAVPVDRALRRPERLHDADLLRHQGVAVLLAVADAVGGILRLRLPGDQVDRDPPAGELVEGRHHLRQHHRVDVARPRRDQHADGGRPAGHEGGGDPGLPAGHRDRDQQVFEPRCLGRGHHAVEHRGAGGHHVVAIRVARGVAVAGQVPAEFQRAHRPSVPHHPAHPARHAPAAPGAACPVFASASDTAYKS